MMLWRLHTCPIKVDEFKAKFSGGGGGGCAVQHIYIYIYPIGDT